MHYKVYLDLVFFNHFALQCMALFVLRRMARYSAVRVRDIVKISFFTSAVLVMLCVWRSWLLLKILVYCVALFYSLGLLVGKYEWRALCFWNKRFYLSMFLIGGLMAALQRVFPGWPVIMLGIVCGVLVRILYIREREDRIFITVCLEHRGNKICADALVDTGNFLIEPISQKPVCIISKRLWERLWREEELFRLVPFHSVGRANGVMKAYRVDCMEFQYQFITHRLQDVYLAVAEEGLGTTVEGSVEMIMNVHMLE